MLNDEVKSAVDQLINETEDKDDALAYADDLAIEYGVDARDIVTEIERQYEEKEKS